MLTICIKDLPVEGKHGVHPHEKTDAQLFIISVEVMLADDTASVSDDLKDTLNWSEVRRLIIDTVQNNSFDLMERLAQEIAGKILADKRVQKVVVSIDKPQAFETGVPSVRLEVKPPAAD